MSGSSPNKPSITKEVLEAIIKVINAAKKIISPTITPQQLENITKAVLSNKKQLSPPITQEQKDAIVKAVLKSREEIQNIQKQNKKDDQETIQKLAKKIGDLAKDDTFKSIERKASETPTLPTTAPSKALDVQPKDTVPDNQTKPANSSRKLR